MKTLVIGDIHNRWQWIERAIEEIKPDKTVFLGDYLDNWNDTPSIAKETAQWLKHSLTFKNRVHLWGNHDMPYAFPMNTYLTCPGFDTDKSRAINSVMRENGDLWKQLKLAHHDQGWWLSHGGLSTQTFPYLLDEEMDTEEYVYERCESALRCAEGNLADYVTQHSPARGYPSNGVVGGVTWLDWNVEFVPIYGINQIVGHTIVNTPGLKYLRDPEKTPYSLDARTDLSTTYNNPLVVEEKDFICSTNYNIDTNNKHLLILEDGDVSIIRNPYHTQEGNCEAARDIFAEELAKAREFNKKHINNE